MFNPLRFIKGLFVDFLIATTGTYVGSPEAPAHSKTPENPANEVG